MYKVTGQNIRFVSRRDVVKWVHFRKKLRKCSFSAMLSSRWRKWWTKWRNWLIGAIILFSTPYCVFCAKDADWITHCHYVEIPAQCALAPLASATVSGVAYFDVENTSRAAEFITDCISLIRWDGIPASERCVTTVQPLRNEKRHQWM